MAVHWQPFRATVALLFVLLSAVASAVILLSSNQQPVNEWFAARARPTVLLAVCTVAANVAINFALSEGLPIRWWLASRTGSVDRLRETYKQGVGAWGAISGVLTLKPSRAGLACIATMLVALNGPLLQRASRVENVQYTVVTDIATHLAATAPFGFSGIKSGRESRASQLKTRFAQVVSQFNSRSDMLLNGTGCAGVCQAEIEGMGFAVNCSEGTYAYNMNPDTTPNGFVINRVSGIVFWTDISPRFAWDTGEAAIDVSTKWKNTSGTAGRGFSKNCTSVSLPFPSINLQLGANIIRSLNPATVKYPVDLSNSTVTLRGTINDDKTVNLSRIQDAPDSMPGPTTLGGFLLAAQLRYNSGAIVWFSGATGYAISTNGTLGFEFAHGSGDMDFVQMTWGDPMATILEGMRELMFRSAMAEANSTLPAKVSSGTMTSQRQIYQTEFMFMALGLASVALGFLGVLPLFWKMWQVKEDVTLSPIEVIEAWVGGKLDFLKTLGIGTDSKLELYEPAF